MQTKFPNDYLKVCFYLRNETFTLALVEVEMKKKLTQQAVMYEDVKTNKWNTGKKLIYMSSLFIWTNVVWKSTNKALGFRTMWQGMKFVMQFNVILNSSEKYWSAKLHQRVDLSHKNEFVDFLQTSSDLRTKDACRENFTLGELWNLAWKTKTNRKIFALATAISLQCESTHDCINWKNCSVEKSSLERR